MLQAVVNVTVTGSDEVAVLLSDLFGGAVPVFQADMNMH
jgi:hypothetical protein